MVEREIHLSPWQRVLWAHVVVLAMRDPRGFGYFRTDDLYDQAELHLHAMFPCNNHIHATIRDELQNLEVRGLVRLEKRGLWQVIAPAMPCCRECRNGKCGPGQAPLSSLRPQRKNPLR